MNFDQKTFFLTKNLPKIAYFSQIKTRGFQSPNDEFAAKKEFVSKFGPDIPNNFIIDKIKYFVSKDIVLQLDTGFGLIASYLKESKINIFTVDSTPNQNAFCQIINLDYKKAIDIIKSNVLFLTHPTPNSAEILDCVKLFNGDKIIWIANENPNADKLLIEYLFRKFYVAQKYQIDNFGNKKNTIFFLKRK